MKKLSAFIRVIKGPFLSKVSKSKFMRATVTSHEATTAAPLGPLLGQFQVPMLDFCNSFNEQTEDRYGSDIDVRVWLRKFEIRYAYEIRYPKLTFLIHQLLLENLFDLDEFIFEYYELSVSDLWFPIYNFSTILEISVLESASLIFGYLVSSKIHVKEIFRKF